MRAHLGNFRPLEQNPTDFFICFFWKNWVHHSCFRNFLTFSKINKTKSNIELIRATMKVVFLTWLSFIRELYSLTIKGKLQTGDRILFVNGIDVKTININYFKECYDAAAKKMDKKIRLRVQHDAEFRKINLRSFLTKRDNILKIGIVISCQGN